MQNFIEASGFIERDGAREPFVLRVSEPTQDDEAGDYYCRVHIPALLKSDKEIYGIDAEQAKQLAARFAKQILSDTHLVDANGQTLKLDI